MSPADILLIPFPVFVASVVWFLVRMYKFLKVPIV
jgi:hypothetical protein